MPPDYCPNCGAEVPPNAKACPECGSDENTGWSDRAHAGRLGIPDDDLDYDEFIKEEFGVKRSLPIKPRGIRWSWWAVAILLVILFLYWWFA